MKDFQLTSDGQIVQDNIDSNAPTTRTVNGAVNPSLSIAPGETQLWRLANIGADIWYQVALEGHAFYVIGEDANPVWQTWSADSLVLPPGKRFDVLVQGRIAGTYIFRTLDFDQGGDHYPDTTLATLTVEGTAVTPAAMPTSLYAQDDPVHGDLSSATVDKERTLVFSEDDDDQRIHDRWQAVRSESGRPAGETRDASRSGRSATTPRSCTPSTSISTISR